VEPVPARRLQPLSSPCSEQWHPRATHAATHPAGFALWAITRKGTRPSGPAFPAVRLGQLAQAGDGLPDQP